MAQVQDLEYWKSQYEQMAARYREISTEHRVMIDKVRELILKIPKTELTYDEGYNTHEVNRVINEIISVIGVINV
jgi:hypothetical protein